MRTPPASRPFSPGARLHRPAPSPRVKRPAACGPQRLWRDRNTGAPRCILSCPLLKFQRPPVAAPGVRPTQSLAPKAGLPREQSLGCKNGGGGAGRERGESAGQGPVRADPGAWWRRPLCGRTAAAPRSRPGTVRATQPSGPASAAAGGKADLAGASSPRQASRSAAPERPASRGLAGTPFAPWRRRGPAGRRRCRGMSCPQQHWAPPEVPQKMSRGRAPLGGMEGRWNEAPVFGGFPWIHTLHITCELLHQLGD